MDITLSHRPVFADIADYSCLIIYFCSAAGVLVHPPEMAAVGGIFDRYFSGRDQLYQLCGVFIERKIVPFALLNEDIVAGFGKTLRALGVISDESAGYSAFHAAEEETVSYGDVVSADIDGGAGRSLKGDSVDDDVEAFPRSTFVRHRQ